MIPEAMRERAAQYKPSIQIKRAPGPLLPGLFMLTGWVFLAVIAALLPTQAAAIASGHFGQASVVALVHLLTLGFLTMTMTGILYQWVPVVFNVPSAPTGGGLIHYGLYVTGVVALVAGMNGHVALLLAWGGGLVSLTILAFSTYILSRVRQSARPWDAVTVGLVAALVSLNGVWLMGLAMALAWAGLWPMPAVLQFHLLTAIVGWVALLVMSVQLKLFPMFAMGRADAVYPAVPLTMVGIGLGIAWSVPWIGPSALAVAGVIWLAAGLITITQGIMVVRSSQAARADVVLYAVGIGWVMWLGAAAMVVFDAKQAVVWSLWGAMTFIVSYQSRIIPFIVSLAIARNLPGPVMKTFFMAQAMGARKFPLVVAGLSAIGLACMIFGLDTHSALAIDGAAVALMVLVGTHVFQIVGALWVGYRRARREPSQAAG